MMGRKGKKILDLVLEGKWFDMIAEGEKKEEYRECKPYWRNRLILPEKREQFDKVITTGEAIKDGFSSRGSEMILGTGTDLRDYWRGYTHVRFHRGYTDTTILVKCRGCDIGFGKEEWGAPSNTQVYRIKLGQIVGV